jgi:hypothetical protein
MVFGFQERAAWCFLVLVVRDEVKEDAALLIDVVLLVIFDVPDLLLRPVMWIRARCTGRCYSRGCTWSGSRELDQVVGGRRSCHRFLRLLQCARLAVPWIRTAPGDGSLARNASYAIKSGGSSFWRALRKLSSFVVGKTGSPTYTTIAIAIEKRCQARGKYFFTAVDLIQISDLADRSTYGLTGWAPLRRVHLQLPGVATDVARC